MAAHSPSLVSRILETLNRVFSWIGLDFTAVKPIPPDGNPQLEFLNRLLRSFQEERTSTFAARLITRDWYRKALSWPKKVLALPHNQNKNPILFLCGIPRSGTTFANELMAADPDFRILTHQDIELDMEKGKKGMKLLFKEGYSAIDAIHPLSSPPEDLQIMGQYVVADLIMGLYGSEYVMSFTEEEQHSLFVLGYRFEKQVYERLPIRAEQAFVIKSPIIHMMFFPQFQQAFDDYRMLLMVRDLPTAVLSTCHIFEVGIKYMKDIEPAQVGPLVLYYVEGYVRGLERLSDAEREKFAFVDFHRFVKDPFPTLERVYAWLGRSWTPELRARYEKQKTELERVHVSKVSKPTAEYYHLDMEAVRELDRRYKAIYSGRLW